MAKSSVQLERLTVEEPFDPETGDGIKWGKDYFYYRPQCRLPKDAMAFLRCEHHYMGRVKGEVHHLAVAWDGQSYVLLAHLFPGEVKTFRTKHRGRSASEVIAAVLEEKREIQARIDARPKCRCGEGIVLIDKAQRRDECFGCFKKRKAAGS